MSVVGNERRKRTRIGMDGWVHSGVRKKSLAKRVRRAAEVSVLDQRLGISRGRWSMELSLW